MAHSCLPSNNSSDLSYELLTPHCRIAGSNIFESRLLPPHTKNFKPLPFPDLPARSHTPLDPPPRRNQAGTGPAPGKSIRSPFAMRRNVIFCFLLRGFQAPRGKPRERAPFPDVHELFFSGTFALGEGWIRARDRLMNRINHEILQKALNSVCLSSELSPMPELYPDEELMSGSPENWLCYSPQRQAPRGLSCMRIGGAARIYARERISHPG